MRGRYIALEGVEGAGKSSVVSPLVAFLEARGVDVLRVREPGGTPAGEQIRHVLLDPAGEVAPWTEAMLFAAGRAQLAAAVVEPALAAGRWVVTDRSVYSSLAYQGGGRGLGIAEVRAVNKAGLGRVWPELVVLLRVPVSVGLARQEVPDRIGGEALALHRRVSATFDTLAAEEPSRIAVVDASQPLDTVVETVCSLVEERWTTFSNR